MNDHELRDAYEAALQRRDKASPPIELPLDRLEALIEGEGDEAERLLERHGGRLDGGAGLAARQAQFA